MPLDILTYFLLVLISNKTNVHCKRVRSSVGRASDGWSEGRGFDTRRSLERQFLIRIAVFLFFTLIIDVIY